MNNMAKAYSFEIDYLKEKNNYLSSSFLFFNKSLVL